MDLEIKGGEAEECQLSQDQNISNKVANTPLGPGIYKMLNDQDQIIYIGKAKSLKKRVAQYFNRHHHDPKTKVMIKQIKNIEYVLTTSEKEALILESQLIKTYQPKYNILLKDDKSFPYIKITNEIFPKIEVVRYKKNDGAHYFGPYPSMGSTRAMKNLLYDIFPLRDCKQKITLMKKQPKCLLLDIGKCIGPCIYKGIKASYDQWVEDAKLFIKGKNKKVLATFKKKMKEASDEEHFELAACFRDRIQKIEAMLDKQRVDLNNQETFLVIGGASDINVKYILIQAVIEGKWLFQKGLYASEEKETAAFVQQVAYEIHEYIKLNQITVVFGDRQTALYEKMLENMGAKIKYKIPQRGAKKDILELVNKNAVLRLKKIQEKDHEDHLKRKQDSLRALQLGLGLKQSLNHIVGFDISHLQGTNIVASSVWFQDGIPKKEFYRRYQIKSIKRKSNDPASMAEVVSRFLKRVDQNRQEICPDLWVIDGGIPQLNAVISIIEKSDLKDRIQVLALAKREEWIYRPGGQIIKLRHDHKGLQLLQQVRDEAHRFALSYQRNKRKKMFKENT